MIKTWLVAPFFPLGGAERQMHELAKSFSSDLLLVDMQSDVKNRTLDGVNVLGMNNDVLHLNEKNRLVRRFKRYVSLFKFFLQIKEANIQQVVFYSPIFLPLVYALSYTQVKVGFSIREYKSSLFKGFELACIKKANIIFTNTVRASNKLSEQGLECKLTLNTIPPSKFSTNKYTRANTDILVVSNLQPHKNVHMLLNATKKMRLNIRVAGEFSNTVYYEKCKKIAGTSCCNIEFLGSIEKDFILELLQKATCLIHPSLLEGTSNAILDAINTETPLLVSDIPENSYLVDDLNDFLFTQNNELALKNKIEFLLENRLSIEYKNKMKFLNKRLSLKFSNKNLNEIYHLLQ
jgi:glycosyltransferase involved in cell wall biosynthesis